MKTSLASTRNQFSFSHGASTNRRGAKSKLIAVISALVGLSAGLLLELGAVSVMAQDLGRISGAMLTPSNTVRLVVQPPPAITGDLLLLQSSDSPLGPWWNEPDFQRNPVAGGFEFVTPHKPFYPQRYYRFGLFTPTAAASPTLPFIRLIAPNTDAGLGQPVTLLGANFSPAPSDNTVTFELPGQSWTATVTQAATNFLVATVPTNLLTSSFGDGTLYRVTVTTSPGTGNGVGCSVDPSTFSTFALRPSEVYVILPPGTGKQTLVVGGGVPPYQLVPQSPTDLETAVATLNGPVLEVRGVTANESGVTVTVQDSSSPAQQATADIYVIPTQFSPTFAATCHTLLGGTAPPITMNVTESYESDLQFQRLELQFQNAGIEVSRLQPGQIVGLFNLGFPGGGAAFAFLHLTVTEVGAGRAKFDVVSLGDGGITTAAQGELIESPPTLVIYVPNLAAGSLLPLPLGEELILGDSIFQLPAGAGQTFTLTANFTSVSAREDTYLPQQASVTNWFTTTGLASGAPRIDRLLPIHGEVGRNVQLIGVGFGASPTDNTITFAGHGGTRVPAKIVLQTNDEIVVTVPENAISGAVELAVASKTSNDFLFDVCFHPQTALLFDGFTNNVPTPLELLHQQPLDAETAREVPSQSVICTLAAGHIVVTNLTVGQQVGTTVITSFYDGTQQTNLVVYAGQETNAPQRYQFQEIEYLGSAYPLAWLYYSEDTNGVTLQLTGGDPSAPFAAGSLYDFHFITPIYRPPASAVAVRVETVSQQWMSPPGSEMRRIVNSIQPVQ